MILGLILALLLSTWLGWTAAADSTQTATMAFAEPSYSAMPGEQLVVDLVIVDADDLGGWEVPDLAAGLMDSCAQIEVLAIHEKLLVEPADLPEQL